MADLLLHNGHILTMEQDLPFAQSMLVRGGRIIYVGHYDAAAALASTDVRKIDLQGKTLMPGFIDAHLHFLWGAQYLDIVGLRDAKTFAEVKDRLGRYVHENPERTWIRGAEFSYGYPDMEGKDFHRSMLDEVVSDRPVFFYSGMAHAAWANSKALEMMGINRDTPDPDSGVIMRDSQGDPTGWLLEQAAKLDNSFIPKPSDDEMKRMLRRAMEEANSLGITRVQSAGFDDDIISYLQQWRDEDRLPLRFTLSTVCQPPQLGEEIKQLVVERAKNYHDDFLDARVVKFFIDGVLESHTGYMPEGYADRPDEQGTLLWDALAFNEAIAWVQSHDLQVWSHAIGRGAISFALDGHEADIVASQRCRPRVEHVEIPALDDIDRFRETGSIASLQPAMIYPKDQWMGMVGIWEQRAGSHNLALAFPLRSLLDGRVHLAFGTDWPIVDLNPLVGIRNSVLRQSFDGEPAQGWVPQQRIEVEEALQAYTIGAAFAGHRESQEGSIKAGKLADFIILSDDPLAVAPDQIKDIKVQATFVGGKLVYGSL